jgi:hypothetical protein
MTLTESADALKRSLQEIRRQSLEATRQGDFMRVARLTAKAAQVNKEIMDVEGRVEAAKYGAPTRHAAKLL